MSFNIGETVSVVGNQAFQGDVFIEHVSELPSGLVEMQPDKRGLYVFAEGETTGHVHAYKATEVTAYYANDNSVIGGKRFYVVPKVENPVLFHGNPGHDQGDHAWLKTPLPADKKATEIVRQRVVDLTDPSNFTQVAD